MMFIVDLKKKKVSPLMQRLERRLISERAEGSRINYLGSSLCMMQLLKIVDRCMSSLRQLEEIIKITCLALMFCLKKYTL